MLRKTTLLFAFMGLFSFCKPKKYLEIPRPPEHYNSAWKEAPLHSAIAIPVRIEIDDLLELINNRLSGTLYEDYSYRDNGGDDLMMKAVKSGQITMSLSGQTLRYRAPLKLWFKKNLFVTDAEAEGEIALGFKTDFALLDDWSLSTQTEIEYHEWIRKPVLKTGLGDISVEGIANIFLNRNKRTLSQTIDRIVSQQLSLRPYAEEAWKALQTPIFLSDAYQLWVKTTPTAIGITPITTDNRAIQTTIAVETLNDVVFGAQPAFRADTPLPNLTQIYDAPEDFQMRFMTNVPFPEAERLANGIMVGQQFESGGQKVRVEDIRLWGNDEKVVAGARVSGAYDGEIYFIGRPVFNTEKNQIEVEDLDFHAQTSNVLHKSAAWLFKGAIRKKMQESLVFPVHQNMADLQMAVQKSLNRYEIRPGVVLSGVLDSMSVEDTNVTPDGLRVDLFAKGKLRVDIQALQK
jgi:hypothetical protein